MGAHGRHAHPTTDVTIDYSSAGDGPAIVLVHGISENRRAWDPLIAPFLAEGYRVIAVDLRGHGESSKVAPYDTGTMSADLGAVLAAESLDDALLVGHSLGGVVVSGTASAGPCRGVVNVDQPLALAGFQEGLRQMEPALRGEPAAFQGAIGGLFDQMAGPLDGHQRWRIDRLRDADQDVMLGVWDLVLTSTSEELEAVVDSLAGGITVPYLSLHGIDPGSDYEAWLTQRIPRAEVEVWPDLGHYPHLIDQDRFVRRVVEFDPAGP